MDIASAKVIVTGGASGLGAATARYLAGEGALVTVFDRDATKGAEMAALPGISFAEVDVTSEDSVAAGVAHAVAEMGGITAVVNCAGIVTGAKTVGSKGPFPLDAFQRTIDINLVGAFNVARLAAVEMSKNAPNEDGERGVIVNTASINGLRPGEMQGIYSITKAAVISLTKSFAKECAPLGIRVNALLPGLTKTAFAGALFTNEAIYKETIRRIPMGRHAEPAEMAGTVLYLVSDASSYTTGECIVVDGGMTL